jgi:hypothetical protein
LQRTRSSSFVSLREADAIMSMAAHIETVSGDFIRFLLTVLDITHT